MSLLTSQLPCHAHFDSHLACVAEAVGAGELSLSRPNASLDLPKAPPVDILVKWTPTALSLYACKTEEIQEEERVQNAVMQVHLTDIF